MMSGGGGGAEQTEGRLLLYLPTWSRCVVLNCLVINNYNVITEAP